MIAVRHHTRVRIDGEERPTGATTVSEALGQLCVVADVPMAAQPTAEPDIGDGLQVAWVDLESGTAWKTFGGTISSIEVDSGPWSMTLHAVDQMELMRKIKTLSDMDLTGMTDGEAVMALLDYCGVDYDAADIADADYVLGAKVPVAWHADGQTSAGQMLQEIDNVFRMATFCIGDNRVIRIPYDLRPADGSGSARTYTKGVDSDFFAHRRTHGDRDQIRTVWNVTGVQLTDAKNCTETVWAHAEHGTSTLGRGVRVGLQSFQSDLIQDQALAEAVAARLMKETSSLPETGTLQAENDPNIHPGSKITLTDTTYGIEADPRYFCVTSVTRTPPTMQLDLSGGPPGETGTITSGVQRVCTDVQSDTSWPGSFDYPAFDYPPFDVGLPTDFAYPDFGDGWTTSGGGPAPDDGTGVGDDAFSGPECINLLLAPRWVDDDPGTWGPVEAGTWVFDGDTGVATVAEPVSPFTGWAAAAHKRTGVPSYGTVWTLTAEGFFDSAITGFFVELFDDEDGSGYLQDVHTQLVAAGSTLDSQDSFFVDDDLGNGDFLTTAELGTPFLLVMERTSGNMTMRFESPVGTILHDESFAESWETAASAGDLVIQIAAWNDAGAGTGTMTLTGLHLCQGGDVGVAVGTDWEIVTGNWSFDTGNVFNVVDTTDAQINLTGLGASFTPDQRVRVSGRFDVTSATGSETDVYYEFGLVAGDLSAASSVLAEWGAAITPHFDYGFWSGGGSDSDSPAPFTPYLAFDFACDWNPATSNFHVHLDDGSTVVTKNLALGTPPSDFTFFVRITKNGESVGLNVTDILVITS